MEMETLHRDRLRYPQLAQRTSYFFEELHLCFRLDRMTNPAVQDMPVAKVICIRYILNSLMDFQKKDSPGQTRFFIFVAEKHLLDKQNRAAQHNAIGY